MAVQKLGGRFRGEAARRLLPAVSSSFASPAAATRECGLPRSSGSMSRRRVVLGAGVEAAAVATDGEGDKTGVGVVEARVRAAATAAAAAAAAISTGASVSRARVLAAPL